MRHALPRTLAVAIGLAFLLPALSESRAFAATYRVGPGQPLASFSNLPALASGDVVEIMGNATYGPIALRQAGAPGKPITLRGVPVSGKRPVFSGGANTVDVSANHYVIENVEITGGTSRCVFHRAHDITIRNTAIHDCPQHGILGGDNGSGSLTLDATEVYRCGAGDQKHQIYMATDENAHPGAVFRMQNCYIHDGNGGNGVKTRAERNEIYYNWIEGSYYHELELIGPDPQGGIDERRAREDSDVVGNVIRKGGKNPNHVTIRAGGDGTGQTYGRYRFVNNTILLAKGSGAVFRLFTGLESLEMHNNVIFREGGGGVQVRRLDSIDWASGREIIEGTNNWIPQGSSDVPAGWRSTLTGTDPGFRAIPADLRPRVGSVLVNAGSDNPLTIGGHEFPRPLAMPASLPPVRGVTPVKPRVIVGPIDVGAFEDDSAAPPPAAPSPAPAPLPPAPEAPPVLAPPVAPPPPAPAPEEPPAPPVVMNPDAGPPLPDTEVDMPLPDMGMPLPPETLAGGCSFGGPGARPGAAGGLALVGLTLGLGLRRRRR